MIRRKRVYDPPAKGDGRRVLVDRLWPRGLGKEAAAIDSWAKEVAPSDSLRKWFGHDPRRFDEFARRYRRELREAPRRRAMEEIMAGAARGTVTLLYAARDEERNNAAVLAQAIAGRKGRRRRPLPSERSPAGKPPRARPLSRPRPGLWPRSTRRRN